MRQELIGAIIITLCVTLTAFCVEAPVNLSGTWVLDKSERSFSPSIGSGGMGGGMPGGGQAGGGYPGGGMPGGGYPGGGGSGYPGGGGGGGYPGGGSGGGYPGGSRRGGGGFPGGGGPGGGPEAGGPLDQSNLILTINQTADELQVTRKWDREGRQRQVTQTFSLDGKENQNETPMGGELMSKTKWHKRDLVTEGTQRMSTGNRNFEIKVKEEFSLSKDGQVLTIKTSSMTPAGQMQIKQTFKKS